MAEALPDVEVKTRKRKTPPRPLKFCRQCGTNYKGRSTSRVCSDACMLAWNKDHLPTGLRRCRFCKEERPIDHYRLSAKHGLYDWQCKACKFTLLPDSTKKKRQKQLREATYLRLYGMDIEAYDAMYAAQNGLCKICKDKEPETNVRRLSVDHCHASGEVRGLLCGQCNLALGAFRDDPLLLYEAITYLGEEALVLHKASEWAGDEYSEIRYDIQRGK